MVFNETLEDLARISFRGWRDGLRNMDRRRRGRGRNKASDSVGI
jgi:hypothetical protein